MTKAERIGIRKLNEGGIHIPQAMVAQILDALDAAEARIVEMKEGPCDTCEELLEAGKAWKARASALEKALNKSPKNCIHGYFPNTGAQPKCGYDIEYPCISGHVCTGCNDFKFAQERLEKEATNE